MISLSVRRCARAAAVATSILGAAVLSAPAAYAGSTITRPTSNVWTGAGAMASCQAFGQQQVASGNWDGYSCKPDPAVAPDAIQAWVIIWVGCPTCARRT